MPYTRYIEIDAAALSYTAGTLQLLDRLDPSAMESLDLHIYAITNDPQILDAAREAIAEEAEVAEEDVQLAEVALAISLDYRTPSALRSSGIKLNREDFAYMGSGGEGVRTSSFVFAHYKPAVTVENFNKMAIASSESWLDDFLRKHGSGQPAKVTQNVHRTEEATQPGVPPPPQQVPPPIPPKQTSEKLSRFLDDFLD